MDELSLAVFVATGAEWVFAADQPPRIHASEEDVFIDGDIVIEAGSTFSLQCQAQRPVKWSLASLPKVNRNNDAISVSQRSILVVSVVGSE